MPTNHYAVVVTSRGRPVPNSAKIERLRVARGVYLLSEIPTGLQFSEGVQRNGKNGAHSRVKISDYTAVIRPDHLGARAILTYQTDGIAVCANSVAKIVEALDTFGADVSIDPVPLSTTFALGNLQVYQTPVHGVRLLPVGHRVQISHGRLLVEKMHDNGASLLTSEALRDRVIDDIIGNVSTTANRNGDPLLLEMTGGLDSRVTFAAMMHCRLRDRIFFATRGTSDQPDRMIAERIAHAFDIQMVRRPYFEETLDPDSFVNRSKHQAGLRWLDDVSFRMRNRRKGLVVFSGNYGEIWRSYYAEVLIAKSGLDRTDFATRADEAHVEMLFDAISGPRKEFLAAPAETLRLFSEHLLSFPGSFGEALFDLYISQRNRFHYGGAAIARDGLYVACDPLYSISAYHYAKRLDPFERATGHFSFELIDRMFPALNSFPLAEKTVPTTFAQSSSGRHSIVATKPMEGMITRAPLRNTAVFEGQTQPHLDPGSEMVAEYLDAGAGREFLDTDLLASQYKRASSRGRRMLERALISPVVFHKVLNDAGLQRKAIDTNR